jgi:uncharacterized protein YbaP (TraB family)
MLPANQSLDQVVSADTYASSQNASPLWSPDRTASTIQPWMIALTIEGLEWQKAGFDSDLGLDKHFTIARRPSQAGAETGNDRLPDFALDGMTRAQQDHLAG